ncbi:hypothetical protein DCC81_05610 [Chitinophaga parva]|uniref:Uncharacterized protein n=1 Tax=Chitinophaga parva TaxID=2169414 RepID=A0A2T7BMS6_9BACT|nr:hypothetical protein DCC81_05610 [Chitinophaga parva]
MPEGYFAALPDQVMQRIRAAEDAEVADILGTLPKISPLTAPAPGYFSQLGSQVMQRIHHEEASTSLEEAREIDGILAGLPRNHPFTPAPPAYFETLGSQVMGRIQQEEEGAGVVPMKQPHRTWVKWAVAACTAGILATAGILRYSAGSDNAGPLAKVSDQELVDYLQSHNDEFDNDAIYASVSNTTATPEQQKTQPGVQLDDVSTDDLNQYIETTNTNDL